MAFILSSNMNLAIPTVGQEAGPQFAYDINNSLTTVDQHDHSIGKGVQITPAGININALLTFADNPATSLSYLSFSPQNLPSTVAQSLSSSSSSNINELFYTDSNGTTTQITKNGLVNATASSIPGESYDAGSFIWVQTQSGLATTPANFDIGSIILRPNTALTSNGVQLIPPSSVQTTFSFPNYSAALTGSIPTAISVLEMDTSGNISPLTPASTGNQVLSSNGSTLYWNPVSTGPTQQVFTSGSGTYTLPSGVVAIKIRMIGGGGGGGGSGNTSPGNGGNGGNSIFGSYQAGGGGGGFAGTGLPTSGRGGTPSNNSGSALINLLGGAGGNTPYATTSPTTLPLSGAGGQGVFGGGAPAVSAGNGAAAQANTGGGGSGAGSNSTGAYFSGGGGAAGSYLEQVISNPSSTYSYTVGAAGSAGSQGGGSGTSGGAGSSGLIIIDEFRA